MAILRLDTRKKEMTDLLLFEDECEAAQYVIDNYACCYHNDTLWMMVNDEWLQGRTRIHNILLKTLKSKLGVWLTRMCYFEKVWKMMKVLGFSETPPVYNMICKRV